MSAATKPLVWKFTGTFFPRTRYPRRLENYRRGVSRASYASRPHGISVWDQAGRSRQYTKRAKASCITRLLVKARFFSHARAGLFVARKRLRADPRCPLRLRCDDCGAASRACRAPPATGFGVRTSFAGRASAVACGARSARACALLTHPTRRTGRRRRAAPYCLCRPPE